MWSRCSLRPGLEIKLRRGEDLDVSEHALEILGGPVRVGHLAERARVVEVANWPSDKECGSVRVIRQGCPS